MTESLFRERDCARWKRRAEQLEEVATVNGTSRLLALIDRLATELGRRADSETYCLRCGALTAVEPHESNCPTFIALNEAAELVVNDDDH